METIASPRLRRLLLFLVVILVGALAWPGSARSQDASTPQPVWVEAIQAANVRAGPGLEYPQIAAISAGTKYRMVGRHSRARWYLIALPRTLGWVYVDLVSVTGDINT